MRGLSLACFSVTIWLAGCEPAHRASFKTSLLPPTPKPSVASAPGTEPLDPPAVSPSLYWRESPTLPPPIFPPQPTQVELRLSRAEARYEEGRKLYQEGNLESARRAFDEALDLILDARGNRDNEVRQRIELRVDRLVSSIHRYDMEGLGASETEPEPVFDKAPIDEILTMTFPIDPKLRNKVRDELLATVSQLPLEINDSVLSYINYFSSERGEKTLRAGLRRAGRYRPMITRILEEEGLPKELIYLAQAESGFLPRAVSRKQAGGMWQFVKFRGREYDLNQTPYSDDRFDPERSTRAAARHLRDLYARYGDWYLAIAAYNCGPGNVDRAVARTGYADVWELRRRGVLPKETSNYVPIILAITIMAKNAKDYGLDNLIPDNPIEYDTVAIHYPANLPLISDLTLTPLSEIRELNPALLKSMAPGGYSMKVPRGTGATVTAALDAIPKEARASWRVHRVESGDNADGIAKRYGVTLAALTGANPGGTGSLQEGDRLTVPVAQPPREPPVRQAARETPKTGKSGASRPKPRTATQAARKGKPAGKGTTRIAAAPRPSPQARKNPL